MATLDPITNTVIYNDKEQFDNEYDNFGNRTSSMAPSVDNPDGLETAIPNAANTPASTTSQIDGQSTSEVSLVDGFLQSSNFIDYNIDPVNAKGWQINSDGNVQFNNGLFRGSLTVGGNAWHVDINGNMWWGNYATYAAAVSANAPYISAAGYINFVSGSFSGAINIGSGFHVDSSGNVWWGSSATYAGATIKISSAGSVNFTTGTFSGTLSAPSGDIGGWTISSSTLASGAITLDSGNTRIKAAVDSNNYVEMYGNVGAGDSYIHGQVAAVPSFYFGYKSSGTYNILNNLRIANVISTNPSLPNYPYGSLEVQSDAPNYLLLNVWNSAVSIAPFYFNGDGSFEPQSITLSGVNRTTWPSGGTTTLSGLSIDVQKGWGGYGIVGLGNLVPIGPTSGLFDLGTSSLAWGQGYINKISGNFGANVIDFNISGRIATNQDFTFKSTAVEVASVAGSVHWNTATGTLRVYDGAGWRSVTVT